MFYSSKSSNDSRTTIDNFVFGIQKEKSVQYETGTIIERLYTLPIYNIYFNFLSTNESETIENVNFHSLCMTIQTDQTLTTQTDPNERILI